ncbi:MAG: CDP-diacylglycerol--glycerol-3-phosphate 3-phosphatidyltransferase [Bathelium mastoideum]|nr:MAG: CDP-diacylglycerol--glycerol-3-phosphate 3-phosphatidyltransferase [Bathelium mastoideum]
MLARHVARWARCQHPSIFRSNSLPLPQGKAKASNYLRSHRYTTASPPAEQTAIPQSPISKLAVITDELDRIAPSFKIKPDQITILKSPDEFYETLKAKISKARHRIYLSTLYVGKTEHDLLNVIRDALRANKTLKVSFLTDALRGTREDPQPSCATLLGTLLAEFGPERVEVAMFHTPNLTGIRKAILPKRINEGWGLQHMKLYGVDDELIMSGANLSNDYFTNRQDRYHVFSSQEIADYFKRIHDAVCSISFQLLPDDRHPGGFVLEWPQCRSSPSPLDDSTRYRTYATKLLDPLIQPSTAPIAPQSPSDTTIYPLLQFTPLLKPRDTSTELPTLRAILRSLSFPALTNSHWTFTAGYFNMTPEIRTLLLATSPSSATVLAASPWANGFYGSPGVSGLLPAAYTLLARRFLDAVAAAGLGSRLALKEWRRGTVGEPGGWTYHAKGLWVTLPGEKEKGPSVSLVGSSNYTKRSYALDLEANCLVVTRDPGLMRRLGEEERWLQEWAKAVGRDDYMVTERRVGLHVRIAMAIVTLVGGAL